MSLGGYMFAGKYCNKGSLTDTQWAHLMHATKVAAFMAANTRANAGWEYDMTGSPDGNIHCLDSVGNNYVTVFKRTNGTDDYTWFALYTLSQTTTSSATGYVTISTYASYLGTSTSYYMGGGCSNFVRIGKTAITYSDNLASPNTGTSLLFPVGNPYSTTVIGVSNSMMNNTSAFFGFAIKQCSIVMLSGKNNTSGLCVSIISGKAFSSLCNENDTNECLIFNAQQISNTASNNYEMNNRILDGSFLGGFCLSFNNAGVGHPDYGTMFVSPMAQYTGSVQSYPFQCLQIQTNPNTVTGVSGKGVISIDLLSFNTQNVGSSGAPSIFSSVANGKYLTIVSGKQWTSHAVIRQTNRVTNPANYTWLAIGYPAMYCGWDPSNPDITQASSWQEYTE